MSARMARAAGPGKKVIPGTRGPRFLVVRHRHDGVWLEIDTGTKQAQVTVPWGELYDAIATAPAWLGLDDAEEWAS